MIRIYVIAAIRLYRDGLEFALSRRDELVIVGSSETATAAEAEVVALRPEIILVDVATVTARQSLGTVKRVAPWASVVALGAPELENELMECVEIGIAGYVPRRDGSLDQLVDTIRAVARGEALCSPSVAATLMRRVAALASRSQPEPLWLQLTPRQLEVARLLRRGLSNKEIAASLQIGVPTTKNHVHAVLEKLGVHRRSEAAAQLAVIELHAPGSDSPVRVEAGTSLGSAA